MLPCSASTCKWKRGDKCDQLTTLTITNNKVKKNIYI